MCVNAIGKLSVPDSEHPPILISTSYERLAERLSAAVGLQAEALSWSQDPEEQGAHIVAIISFYNGTTTKMPDHASLELSVTLVPQGPQGPTLAISIQRITTFGTNTKSSLGYCRNISQAIHQLKVGQVQFPGGEFVSISMVAGGATCLERLLMLDAGLGFAFVLDRAINSGNSSGKTLADYIATFASHAMNAPMAAAPGEGSQSYFSRVILHYRGVQDAEDDELGQGRVGTGFSGSIGPFSICGV